MVNILKSRILGIGKSLVEFLFPTACPLCAAPVSVHGELCGDCWTAFNWIGDMHCARCGYPVAGGFEPGTLPVCPACASGACPMDLIRSACVYDDASRASMLPFKHGGRIQYARFMSRAMIWALRDADISPDVIMPVPLAGRRLRHRGYNQATLLARPIARAMGVPMDLESVRRIYREDMGHKNARQRAENIRGVFEVVNPDKIRGKRILLVDDVMTTGATFYELYRVLHRSGASAVYGLTFCRVARTE